MIRTFLVFRPFVRPYRGLLAGGALLAVAAAALGLARPWPLKVVVDDVLRAPGHRSTGLIFFLEPFAESPRALLGVAVALLLGVVGLSAAAEYWSTRLMSSAGQRIGNDIREAMFAHLHRLSLGYHGKHQVGDLTSRVTADVDRVQDMLVETLSVLVPSGLLIAGMAAVMFAFDPAFAALSLAASPFMAVAIYRFTLSLKRASRRARGYGGQVAAAATESLTAIQVVQAYSLEDRSQAQFRELNRASLGASLQAVRFQARLGPAVDIAAAVSTAAVFWVGANRVLTGRLSLGILLVFISYVGSLYRPIRHLAKLAYVISRGTVSAERIRPVLFETPDVEDRPGAKAAPPLRGAVAFDDVWFSYGREPVLMGINLSIEPGEILALVGPTGAGKSTLASLIPRLFDPQRGAVRIDGVDVRDYTVLSLRSQIALVLQDTVLFQGTLWENVACGRPRVTEAEVRRAAQLALVDEFAERLPDGYDTFIGERGVNLSGGQRQRVAIARAIVRDAPILILDEPTSALDASAEALVVEALRNLMRDRSTLVIAHRLSTVRRADRIAVLEKGRVVEDGAHEALLAAGGTYARLARLQGQFTDVTAVGKDAEPASRGNWGTTGQRTDPHSRMPGHGGAGP
jgi:ABC-type multidrug transport system fused ATPase/permease subunit